MKGYLETERRAYLGRKVKTHAGQVWFDCYGHRMCTVGDRYTPYIPTCSHPVSLSLSSSLSLALRLPTPHSTHREWKWPSGSSGCAQTPVAWCVGLIQYWHKGGGGVGLCRCERACACVCVPDKHTHTHTMNDFIPTPFPPSAAPSLLLFPSCTQATFLTFVPALISGRRKKHTKKRTFILAWLAADSILSHSAPVGEPFPYHVTCKWLCAAGPRTSSDDSGRGKKEKRLEDTSRCCERKTLGVQTRSATEGKILPETRGNTDVSSLNTTLITGNYRNNTYRSFIRGTFALV